MYAKKNGKLTIFLAGNSLGMELGGKSESKIGVHLWMSETCG